MDNVNHKQRAIRIFVAFLAISLLVTVGSNYYVNHALQAGQNPNAVFNANNIFNIAVWIIAYLPMLLLTHKHAKAADMPKLLLTVRMLMVYAGVTVLYALFLLITRHFRGA